MKISYSTSCVVKGRCKFCNSAPSSYYYIGGKNTKTYLRNKKYETYESVPISFSKTFNPRDVRKISDFSFSICFDKTSTLVYRFNKPHFDNQFLNNTSLNYLEIALLCECGKTIWRIPKKMNAEKSNKFYSTKFKRHE